MKVSNIDVNNKYYSFKSNGRRNINFKSNNFNHTDKIDLSKGIPLSDYEKTLFKRFQNFSAENVIDFNTGVDVAAESINVDGLTPRHEAFMQIAKTPFFIIIERIAKDEEEEKSLKSKLHSAISNNFKHPKNSVEEAFSQYLSVVPYITQENSMRFVLPLFFDLQTLDSEKVTDKDILNVIKTHVDRQKQEQRAFEPSIKNKIFNFLMG